MKRQNIFLLISSSILTVIVIFDVILEFLGISSFLFGKRLIDFSGLFIILAAVGYTVMVYSELNSRKDIVTKNTILVSKIIITVIAVFLVAIGFIMCMFLSEKTVYKNVSDDKQHEVLIENDSFYGGWNVTVYKRYTHFFKVERKTFYIDNMTSQDANISVAWYDDSCDISYEYYSDYVDLQEGENVYTQTVYFNDRTEQ